ncbi:MAG: serine/threonine-protein kinase [Nostocaceae cyanobacterium]|nr:serine/threonine-protein kinase [Nostocaceae cyanobacterium]
MKNIILNKRYQIQQELGRQTGRRTYLAQDLQIQQQVVVKILLLGQDFDWQDLKLFEREAETLKTLEHPAIPRYLDYFEFDNYEEKGFGLVQSYVEGKSLESHLQTGRTFSEDEVKEIALDLLNILSYLHKHNPPVIHRDIKPSNILLTNRSGNSPGQVYLVDFGSVQNLAATEGSTITVVGTYGYMPPEQFGGRCVPASDLYSLGATLIYLVTGLHPTELPQQDLQIQFRQSSNLSTKFADWLEWMTEPSLSQRFKSVSEAIKAVNKPRPRITKSSIQSQKNEQPIGSKILLFKNSQELEILIPPQGFGIKQISMISLATPFAIGMNIFTINGLGNDISQFLQFLAIVVIIFAFLSGFFQCLRIRINKKKVVYIHELLGFKWHFSHALNNISHIKLSTAGSIKYGVKPWLVIVTRTLGHDLTRHVSLTLDEMEWLAQELSEHLNLPFLRLE